MKSRRLLLALAAVLIVGAMLPAGAYAGFYNSRSRSADAWWSSWSWDNGEPGPDDATTDWNVSGYTGSGIFKDSGSVLDNSKGSMGWASMTSYAPASGDEPRTWIEFTCIAEPPGLLAFGKTLGTAQLEYLAEGTLNVWKDAEPWIQVGEDEWEQREPDESTSEMVSVVASWKATGPLTRSTYIMRDRSADFLWADRTNQSYRRASAKASIVGASGTLYLQPGTLDFVDAQITEYKSNGRFRGEMMVE